MKRGLVVVAFLVASATVGAEPKASTYHFEKKMSLADCLKEMSKFATKRQLTLVMWEPADFYIQDKRGDKKGNAYFSDDTCYISLD